MNLIVTDFEATCWDRKIIGDLQEKVFLKTQEIIEIGCCVVNPVTMGILRRFSLMIKPVKSFQLSPFCKELTGISQEEVASAAPFDEALNMWLAMVDPWDDIFCSWGDWDDKILKKNCLMHRIPYPFSQRHINIKQLVADELFDGRRASITTRCQEMGITFEGTMHRGLDDAINVVTIIDNMSRQLCEGFASILSRKGLT